MVQFDNLKLVYIAGYSLILALKSKQYMAGVATYSDAGTHRDTSS